MSIRLEGLEDIIQELEKLDDTKNFEKSLQKACAVVERAARKKAPKNNGELRRSITSKVDGLTGVVFTPVEYAPYVEYGTGLFAEGGNGRKDVPWNYQDDKGNWHSTSGMAPHPYMRPALNENRQRILQILEDGLK